MSLEDLAAKLAARRAEDRPVNESLADALARLAERAEESSLERAQALALIEASERDARERRAAIGAATRSVMTRDSNLPPQFVDVLLAKRAARLDGTEIPTEPKD